MNSRSVAFALALLLTLVLSCTQKAVQNQSQTTPPAASQTVDPTAGEVNTAPVVQEAPAASTTDTATAAFIEQMIHFDFDSAVLSVQARQILNAKAEYLHANPGVAVTVEGHCDDRGTNSYNMALGNRRAEMVRTYLVYQGIQAHRVDTISYGEERPLDTAKNEATWARNRRAQFVIH
jgi:peptidoglycan-associated lipoprotein